MANTKALNPPHLLKKIVPNILKCRNIGGNKAEGDEAGFSFVVQTTNVWKRRLSMFRLEVFEALVNPKLRLPVLSFEQFRWCDYPTVSVDPRRSTLWTFAEILSRLFGQRVAFRFCIPGGIDRDDGNN
jgi:hypothetical protein